jgi:hypothetical protein
MIEGSKQDYRIALLSIKGAIGHQEMLVEGSNLLEQQEEVRASKRVVTKGSGY